ncbi:MAG TPA: hypothetical protein VD886_18810 [Herpetosiphonaceae bacterium]|nr:hypothetical protein [Herpetosiphonaceae bacterium]
MLVFRIVLVGVLAGCGWSALAYGKAYFATRRLIYALLGLSWLAGAFAVVTISVIAPGPGLFFPPLLPVMGYLGWMFVYAFSGTHAKSLPEYRSIRDIMLFRPIAPGAARREGLFVPEAPPQRPSSVGILFMTISMISGFVLLIMLFR